MSTCFRFTDLVREEDFRRVLPNVGMTEHVTDETTKKQFCITNGETYVWVYVSNGNVSFSAFGMSGMLGGAMLDLIADELNTCCLSEHEEEFFEDEEEIV